MSLVTDSAELGIHMHMYMYLYRKMHHLQRSLRTMDIFTTASTGQSLLCHPLTITYPSNAEWVIYGSYESSGHIYAQPKCISYPLFVIIKMEIWWIWRKNWEHNVEFGMLILQILTRWSDSIPNFEEFYASLLFNASTLIFGEDLGPGHLACDITDTHVLMIPAQLSSQHLHMATEKRAGRSLRFKVVVKSNWAFENQLRTFVTLRNFWGIRPDIFQGCSAALHISGRKMPPTIPLTSLHLRAWIHDTVNLVSIPHSKDPEALYAFKTNKRTYRFYQELDSLFNMPFHPNVLQPPSYLVTKDTLYSIQNPYDPASLYISEPTKPIVGFLTPFHAGGKLRDVIRANASAGTLNKNNQAKWGRQLISALLHVFKYEGGTANKTRCGTYTCLKMDNIVVGSLGEGSNLVLIDFEKGRNWWYYTPPEIGGFDYIVAQEPLTYGGNILGRQNSEHVYIGPRKCIYEESSWEKMTNREREKAMVYSLGCCLWCILQGNGCIRDVRRHIHTVGHCPWDFAKLDKYETPEAVKKIVTQTFERYFELRPTLQELLDVFESWENRLNDIEVELVGEAQATEVISKSILPLPGSMAEPHCSVECRNTEGPVLGELGGVTLEGGTELCLLDPKL